MKYFLLCLLGLFTDRSSTENSMKFQIVLLILTTQQRTLVWTVAGMKLDDKPLQFIRPSPTEEGKLEIDENTATILSSIHDPVVVISVAGMFRTGKSYLLNRYIYIHHFIHHSTILLSIISSVLLLSALINSYQVLPPAEWF